MHSLTRLASSFTIALTLAGCGRVPNPEVAPEPLAAPSVHANYSVEWVSNDVPATMKAGSTIGMRVVAKNTGDWPWPDPFTAHPPRPDGTYAVRLSYSWYTGGTALPATPVRAELVKAVLPGETASFTIQVTAPTEPGNYELHFDLVQELVAFFSSRGGEKLVLPVTVE